MLTVCVHQSIQHGQQLYRHIYLGSKEEDNVHKNFELLFTTLAVVTIEMANEEVVVDLIRLATALQVTTQWPSPDVEPSGAAIVSLVSITLKVLFKWLTAFNILLVQYHFGMPENSNSEFLSL